MTKVHFCWFVLYDYITMHDVKIQEIRIKLPSMDQFRHIDRNKWIRCTQKQKTKYWFKWLAMFSIRQQSIANLIHWNCSKKDLITFCNWPIHDTLLLWIDHNVSINGPYAWHSKILLCTFSNVLHFVKLDSLLT
jgi:hypothetical protein